MAVPLAPLFCLSGVMSQYDSENGVLTKKNEFVHYVAQICLYNNIGVTN
jgi:hypothetical protein